MLHPHGLGLIVLTRCILHWSLSQPGSFPGSSRHQPQLPFLPLDILDRSHARRSPCIGILHPSRFLQVEAGQPWPRLGRHWRERGSEGRLRRSPRSLDEGRLSNQPAALGCPSKNKIALALTFCSRPSSQGYVTGYCFVLSETTPRLMTDDDNCCNFFFILAFGDVLQECALTRGEEMRLGQLKVVSTVTTHRWRLRVSNGSQR